MKPCVVALSAFALVAGAYFYVESALPIKDDPVTTEATNAVQNSVGLSTSNTTEASSAKAEQLPLIGTLRSRNHTIYLYAGKFSVEDANGKLLARLVDREQFSALLPKLFSEFDQMYAEREFLADNHTRAKLSDRWIYTVPMRTVRKRMEPVSAP